MTDQPSRSQSPTTPTDPAPPATTAFNPWAPPGGEPAGVPVDLLASDEAPRPPRRLRPDSLLRWATAGVVLVATAVAAAVVVAGTPRDQLPGLATPNDGRYDFGPLSLPRLPAGRSAPDKATGDRHFAALPGLLLAPPKQAPGAAPAAAAGCADYAALHDPSAQIPTILATDACREAASRVWTAKDGTRTEIWLLRFGSHDEGQLCFNALGTVGAITRVPQESSGPNDFVLGADQESYSMAGSTEAGGPVGSATAQPTGKVAYLLAGDVVATVVMTNAAGVPSQAFHQVVTLQSELLG